MPQTASDFAALLRVLCEHQVQFIIVGGVGAVLRGAPITTFDLDIVHSRSRVNSRRLSQALASVGATYRGHPKKVIPSAALRQSTARHLPSTRYGPLDVLGVAGRGSGYRELLKGSTIVHVERDVRVRIAG